MLKSHDQLNIDLGNPFLLDTFFFSFNKLLTN